MNKENRKLLDEHRCYVCLRAIPESKGTFWGGGLNIVTCHPGECYDRAKNAELDFSRSARGRQRSPRDFLARLRAMRPVKRVGA